MKNLRTLRAIIRELDSVVSSLDSQHKNINLSKLIPAVCFWRAAIAGNSENAALIRSAFTSTDLGLILSLSKGEKSAVESGNRDPNPLVALLDSTGFLVDAYEFPHSPSFANYIVDVTPDFEAIAKDFDLLPLVPHDDSSESALTALQRYRGYADDEVQSLIHIVWDQLENYQYDSLDEINAAYRTLNMMSGKRLTTFSQEELADFALTKLMSYPVEHLKSAYFEDFGLNLDPIDIRVANELSALAHRFDERQRELKKLAAIDWVLTGEGESPDVVSGPIFEELDPNLFYQQLVAAGPKAIHRAATLFGARLQITNASTYVAGDSDFAGALSNIIRASIPKDGQLKLRDSEFVRLSEVLAKFRDRMISG
jgi:hypothetical protein